MRRETGAAIVLLLCLLIKFPGFVRDYRWLAAVSDQDASFDSIAASARGSQGESASPSQGLESDHHRPLSTQARPVGETSRPASASGLEESALSDSPQKAPFRVPEAYRRDPLAYLSSAPPESLLILPGIGPVIAERIANAAGGKRSFTRWEDLLSVKGIGPKKLEILKQIANTP